VGGRLVNVTPAISARGPAHPGYQGIGHLPAVRVPPSPDDHRRVLAVVAYLNAQ